MRLAPGIAFPLLSTPGWFVARKEDTGSRVRISMSDSLESSAKVKRPATAPGEPDMRARMRMEACRMVVRLESSSEADWKVFWRVVRRVR